LTFAKKIVGVNRGRMFKKKRKERTLKKNKSLGIMILPFSG
jgi:hypothetical protein